MMRFSECLLIALLYGAHVIGQLHAAPYNRKLFSMVNETTTAVPLHYVSTSSTNGSTLTRTTSVPKVTEPTANKQIITKATFDSTTSILAKLTSTAASSIIPGSTGHQQGTERSYFDTTTAAPPYVRPVTVYHEFDALSFMGGALLTICLVIIGTMVWKMYIAHVERRYWTL